MPAGLPNNLCPCIFVLFRNTAHCAAQAGQPATAGSAQLPWPSTAVLRQIPTQQQDYDRWREIWQAINDGTQPSNRAIADRFDITVRTVQRIRGAGLAGLLDSPETPVARLAALAPSNGHTPALTTTP